ncbi:hypothetical protein HMPREF0650_1109 [Hoylesella buccalis ATCC 35310]|uniref:Uncharacterized protein n=1 Tax=Hoylesella buccalis ATCC 35310 TaxID=679190 RepID=D1W6A3_9BACT|nr:T9SS type A sorting domain-containing protein [Hoylesella buccalis]EFA91896.1 hypothetical protein HMPREF0650_1109 [Hoylesella buccalis ATCC 35310]
MKNFTSSRSYRPQVWQRCLLMLAMMLTFGVAAFAQSYTYKVSKIDIGCGASGGSVTLSVTGTSGVKPNGSAQLRRPGNPTSVITVNGVQQLDDANLRQSSTDPNTWTKTWYNLSEGTYDVYFLITTGKKQEYAGRVEVKKINETYYTPDMDCTQSDPYCTSRGRNNGSIEVKVHNGLGPFHFTAEITSTDGTKKTLTSGASPTNERTWKIENLSEGDEVKITVADTQNGICPTTATAATITRKMGRASGPGVTHTSSYYREYLGNCQFNDYVRFRVSGGTAESTQEQIELIKKTARLTFQNQENAVAKLEYDESRSGTSDNNTYLTFKVINTGIDFTGRSLSLNYEDLCSGSMTKVWGTLTRVVDFGAPASDHFLRESMKLTPTASVEVDNNCNTKRNYTLSYDITGESIKYYFPTGTKAQIQQKQGDGSWKTLPINVPLDGVPLFEEAPRRNLNLNEYGAGTYRIVYTDGCSTVALSKEAVIADPPLNTLVIENDNGQLRGKCFYGIHGNAGGTAIYTPDYTDNVDIKIERADGASTGTYKVTEFLSDVEYDYTLNFPIILKNFAPTRVLKDQYGKKTGEYVLYDMPIGKYKITLQDRCGHPSETYPLDIAGGRKYSPCNTDGYKNGFKILTGCDRNDVLMNFGIWNAGGCPDWMEMDYYPGWCTDDQKYPMGPQEYKENKKLWVGTLSYFEASIDVHQPKDENDKKYSVLMGEYIPYVPGTHIGQNNFAIKSFKIPLPSATGNGAFEVQGAMCNLKDPNSGLISVGIRRGLEATYPLHYELKKATEKNKVIVPVGEVLKTAHITEDRGADASLRVFSGLAEGWYQVTAQYNYGNGCPAQVSNVYISPVGIPEVEAEWTEKCYGQGLAPNHLEIPVSTYMYDVTWTRKDLDTGETVEVGTGNAIDATFPKAGRYEFTVSTMFAQSIPNCAGSSGGERKVIITVGDCTGPMEKNLWVGNEDNKFENQNNWTVKVPGDGEDVVFATESNNANPKNPAQKGAAKNDCVLPEGKVLTIGTLENQSDKALVVSKKSSVVVSTALVGYNQPGDAKKLVIKTDEKGTDAGGSFAVSYADPCKSDVYATVELYGRGQKTGNENVKTKDNLQGSPTYGRMLESEPYSWQQIGIPVTDMTPSPVFKGSYLQYYSEAKNSPKQYYQKWSWMAKGDAMSPFVGYQLTQDAPKVYALTGKLNLCDHNLTLTRQAAEVTKSTSANVGEKHWGLGQNIFANSYTAAIDIAQLNFPDEVDPTVYVYHTGSFNNWYENKTTNGTQDLNVAAGGYLAVPKNSASTIGYKSIPSMQGFLLKFTDAATKVSDVPATVTIPYQSVVKNERAAMAKPFEVTTKEPGAVQMILESSKSSDVLWLIEAEGTTDRYDRGWDGRKLLTNAPASLYVQTVDGQMQVNATADLTQQQVTVEGSDNELYTLTIRKKNLPQYEHLKLVDYTTRQLVDLREDVTSYSYTMRHTGVDSNRFKLVNTTATTFGNLPTEIQGVTTATWNGPAVVYTVSGERVANVNQPEDLNRLKAQLPNGVYIVSMQVDGKTVSQKMVITK